MKKAIQPMLNKKNLFYYLMALTLFFILFEVSFFIHSSELYLGDFKLISSHLHVPMAILPGLLFYLSMQLLIHVIYVLCIVAITYGVVIAIPKVKEKMEMIGVVIWVLGIITILLANQYYYPNSKFAYLLSDLFPRSIAKYIFGIFIIFFSSVVLLALSGLFLIFARQFVMRKVKWIFIFFSLGLLGVVGFEYYDGEVITDAATIEKPNIIIIGIDALRPDFLGYFGGTKRTPHLDAFFDQATVFSESMTPLARTFPAWMSILTGEYPKIDNARFDLQTDIHYDLHQMLPSILQQYGYETIFSTDETRFSNIDQTFGFDRMITPPVGFNDFLIGTLNDFPLSNLLVNSPIGRYLFPYSYGNRPVFTTYDPDSFLHLLKEGLPHSRKKPVLLITHFCLAHSPYLWAEQPAYRASIHNYQVAVRRVDQQVNDYLMLLKENKWLEHSIVIILSDHGEAIELRGDRVTDADFFIPGKNNIKKVIPAFYPPALDHELVNQSAGHGTDILSMTQYHTVLAFRFFGLQGQIPSIVSGRVSLLDIKPTLLDQLGIHSSILPEGKSLVSYLSAQKNSVPSQEDFFTESDFSPQAVRSVHPETRKVLFQGINFFEINPITTKLGIKKSMANLIISSKQFADFNGPWVLAMYPQNNKNMTPILVNLDTGFWTNDLNTDFAKHSPVNHMMMALKKFFGKDITGS